MTYTIYALYSGDYDFQYVGRTIWTDKQRRDKHASDAFHEQRGTQVCRWIRELGYSPCVTVLETFEDLDEAAAAETKWISILDTHGNGVNATPTGAELGYRHTEEAKARMSALSHSDAKISQRAALHEYNRERDYGEEFGKTVSRALKGLPKSEAHRKALSEANKGKKLDFAHNKAFQKGARRSRLENPEKWAAIHKRITNIRAVCDVCGLEAVVQTLGRHQKKTGHSGRTLVTPSEELKP